MTQGAPRTSDDHPVMEFEAPRAAFDETVAPNLIEIGKFRPPLETRADRLGLTGQDRDAYVTLARGYDDARDGEVLLYEGKTDEAMERLIPVADSGQRYACYLVAERASRGAQILQSEERIDEALAQYRLALKYEPERLEALVGVGYLDLFTGNLEEADALLTKAVALYPHAAGAVYRLGAVRQAEGRVEDAERLYRDAIVKAPMLGAPRGLLGGLLLARGDAKGALALFDGAIALGDASEGVVAGRAEAKRRLSQP